MVTLEDIAKRVEQIESRNHAVEADKEWETSWFRRLLISVTTYGVAAFFLLSAGVDAPWLSALVPAGGYLLSTLSLPGVKRWWLIRRITKHETLISKS